MRRSEDVQDPGWNCICLSSREETTLECQKPKSQGRVTTAKPSEIAVGKREIHTFPALNHD